MAWQDRAYRLLGLFEGSGNEEGDRTWQIMNHVLDENNQDDYVSRDFYNVQQTAGGLPDGVNFEGYLSAIAGHIRDELQGGGFDEGLDDDDVRTAGLSFDDSIRRHIRFLNGVVHQGAPGEVHLGLWETILQARDNGQSVYSLYRNYLVDA